MGNWVVLSAWNEGNGFHDWHNEGKYAPSDPHPTKPPWSAQRLIGFYCSPVVEQHQCWGKPEEGDVPEFTIEVAYKTADGIGLTPGYRYVLKWLENGQRRQTRSYGYDTGAEAVRAAKAEADRIARRLAPVRVETYRPEI